MEILVYMQTICMYMYMYVYVNITLCKIL